MKIRTIFAALVCKLARAILRLFGEGGTSLPGILAMRIFPGVLGEVSRGMHVIMVTGTNGKTTTCRILKRAMDLDGKECLLNGSGANLLSGITTEFACHTDWRGNPKSGWAVIECDEGALREAAGRIQPEVIVVTNLFRDQLDRYGEVMTTRNKILEGIRRSPKSCLCLNADCPLTSTLAGEVSNPVLYYGVNVPFGSQEEREITDAKHCVRCGAELEYSFYTYAHMGHYRCPACGLARPDSDVSVSGIGRIGAGGSEVTIEEDGEEIPAGIGLPAVYNLYNALASLCAGKAAGMDRAALLEAARTTKAPFGRMEEFTLEGRKLQMILVKNPAGCNQAIEYVTGCGEDYGIIFCLNDRTADGHDISWIWDADFEKIIQDPHRKEIRVSGCRAEEMQLRLKYAGAEEDSILLEKDYARLTDSIGEGTRLQFILPNYTSMLEFRKVLAIRTGGEAFWKEEAE